MGEYVLIGLTALYFIIIIACITITYRKISCFTKQKEVEKITNSNGKNNNQKTKV